MLLIVIQGVRRSTRSRSAAASYVYTRQVKKCEHAWLHRCVKGKYKSMPFYWVVPAATTAGSQGAYNMMAVVRATLPLGEEPWLIRQFGPNTIEPMQVRIHISEPT